MQANSTDKKTFQLTDEGRLIGEIIYQTMFFLKADIKIPNSEDYKILPVGFFKTSIIVTQQDAEIARLVMNWKGQIVITFYDGQEFLLKLNGVFKNNYSVENQDGEKLITLIPKFNWGSFQYNYEISSELNTNQNHNNSLLLALSVYATNYFIAAMSGSV